MRNLTLADLRRFLRQCPRIGYVMIENHVITVFDRDGKALRALHDVAGEVPAE